MVGLDDDQRRRRNFPASIGRCTISSIFAVLSQLALLVVPHFFPSFSLLFQLLLSVVVLVVVTGFGQCCRRLLGFRGSAPAFVFSNILFVWIVYIGVIRPGVSLSLDILLNSELAMLLIGLFRILVSDPGFVRHDCPACMEDSVSEDGAHAKESALLASGKCLPIEATSLSSRRVRYCRICKAYVRGFDHHCPAFGNCIGQKNYFLFMVLLVGCIATEASYTTCSYKWVKRNHNLNPSTVGIDFYESLVVSTMLFSSLQVLWQVFFLAWHIYCVCFNIKTDEWINWRRYPEFHFIIQNSPGQSLQEMKFRNPYNKGTFCNLKDFLFTHD